MEREIWARYYATEKDGDISLRPAETRTDMTDRERRYHLDRWRALLAEVAAEEALPGMEKPAVFIPAPLDPRDAQLLGLTGVPEETR